MLVGLLVQKVNPVSVRGSGFGNATRFAFYYLADGVGFWGTVQGTREVGVGYVLISDGGERIRILSLGFALAMNVSLTV